MFPFWVELSADTLMQVLLGGITGVVFLCQTLLSLR
jgi:hypothetical protein